MKAVDRERERVVSRADHLPGLHALRLVAASAIFVLHVAFFVPLQPPVPLPFVYYFNLGVQLFYVLSAFALMHSTRLYADEPRWVFRFYVKRFFRIAPLYYVMVVVTMTYAAFQGQPARSISEVAANVFFIFNVWPGYAPGIPPAGWSIGVEMLFYVIFPLLFVVVRSIRVAVVVAIFAVIVGLVARALLGGITSGLFGDYGDLSLLTNLPFFAFGILAFLVYARLRETRWFEVNAAAVALLHHLIFATLTAILLALIFAFDGMLRANLRSDMLLWGLVFAIVTVWFALRPLPGLSWAPIQFLGERSYSLYLVHPIIVLVTTPVAVAVSAALAPSMGPLATIAAVFMVWSVVVIVSTLTYAMIERPGMYVGKQAARVSRLATTLPR